MNRQVSIYAGPAALQHIRDNGLSPEDIQFMVGAAGGPKWLVLNHLDRLVFSVWLRNRKKPLFLLGSSIGSWRFTAVSRNDPIQALDRFEYAYLRQSYQPRPSAAKVSRIISRILDHFLDESGMQEILNHPFLRLNVMTVGSRHIMASDRQLVLGPGLACAALFNMVRRDLLRYFFRRVLFYHPGGKPPFFNMNGFPIQRIELTRRNLRAALLASGSIPLVMTGVADIPGAGPGVYRDGGILDYHFDFDFCGQDNGLILYPHYTDRIIPGWLDKKLKFRKPLARNLDRVILVAPSRQFLMRLPFQKIPDRNDFFRFKGQDKARISYWLTVINESRRLADEFWGLVDSGRIREAVQPLPL